MYEKLQMAKGHITTLRSKNYVILIKSMKPYRRETSEGPCSKSEVLATP